MDYQKQQDFFAWEAQSRDTIDFKTVYVDMADDLMAGLLLSQLVYWHLPTKRGTSRMRISKEDNLWVAKTRMEWWIETRLKPRQVDRAGKILVKKGLVFTSLWRFAGSPTTHWRINWNAFLPLLERELEGQEKDYNLPELEFPTFTKEFQDLIGGLLNVPGVYSFSHLDGFILYVGRSVDLGRRITSSFKGRFLTYDRPVYIKYITTKTASDAVLLEMYFITTTKPPFNGAAKFANDSLTLTVNPIPDWSTPVLVTV